MEFILPYEVFILFTKLTISRNLKKSLGEEKYNEINKINKTEKKDSKIKIFDEINSLDNNKEEFKEISRDTFSESTFLEIAPLNFEIDNTPQKDLSSVPLDQIDFPEIVYMIVSKNIELEI